MKLFASDMDGTLLSEEITISGRNLDAIAALTERGILFAIATGRSYVDAQFILARHNLRCPVVGSNGAAVLDADGKLVAKRTIPLDELERLCVYMDEQGIYYGINTTMDLTMRHDWEETLNREPGVSPEQLEYVKGHILSQHGLRFADGFASFLDGKEDSCSLSIASTDGGKLERLREFAERSGKTRIMPSGFGSMEITSANCSKASGLEDLGRFLGITLAEMVSMGDNYNDLDMLLATGRSYAVRNAPAEIQALCTGVTPSCEEDGVAFAIDLLLKEE